MQDNRSLMDVCFEKNLPSHDYLFSIVDNVTSVLENEKKDWRPLSSDGVPGSLISFSNNLPLIVVPDLHARTNFIKHILDYKICPNDDFINIDREITVLNALENKMLNIVLVGDIIHTERRTIQRWQKARTEINNNDFYGQAMTGEMIDSLTTLLSVMMLKIMFSDNFHILKGNHENILNKTSNGDYSFRKCADEGNMVNRFMRERYGDDILYLISCFEKNLPLMFVSGRTVISHAEPKDFFTREQIINARLDGKVIEGLTWTNNGEAFDGTALYIIKEMISCYDENDCVYLAGHRPVTEIFNILQNGSFVQIHNPSRENVAFVYNDRKFNPEIDIKSVK
jgi:hypothetical protein